MLNLVRLATRSLVLAAAVAVTACSDSGSASGDTSQAGLDQIRERLKDRLFEFGSATGNSDRNASVTGVNQLQLCGVGLFALKETTHFSSNVGSTSSENMHYGKWSLRGEGGAVLVDLRIERSTEANPPASKRFTVEVSGDTVRFDGGAVMSEGDVSEDCKAAGEGR